jgi:UDP-GlcNAc3NAcA epimerase
MKKFLLICGNRPQLIKASVLLKDFKCVFVYSGQHYSTEMKNVFFKGLHIRKPDYDLKETELGKMIDKMIPVITKEKPDWIIVYGDTRTTLAGAISATYANVPIIHIEAGCRSYNPKQIEERIRVLVDDLTTIHLTPSHSTKDHLDSLGKLNVFNVGATQIDTMHNYAFPTKKPKDAYKYCVATIHRIENLVPEKIISIFKALGDSGKDIRLYIHPNTEKFIKKNKIKVPKNVKVRKPLPYKQMINEIAFADKIITDSGGLQVEAYYLLRPCVTLREETEWRETLDLGLNILVGTDSKKILEAINKEVRFGKDHLSYGNGTANKNIKLILNSL